MLIANHTAYGFNYFYPSIVKGFNLGSTTITLVLTSPPYLIATISAMCFAYSSDKRGERGYHICIPMSLAAVGFIISAATLNPVWRYVASFLYICGCFSANAMVFSWAASTLSQTPEKRAIATAIINLLSQLGNIWRPLLLPSRRCNAICVSHDFDDGFRSAECCNLCGNEVFFKEGKQEDTCRVRRQGGGAYTIYSVDV